jgi:hypothetical protein
MVQDNIYWLFGSAAQAIAALVAFLITGMALVQAMMENAQDRDDSLVEIHASIQATHYRWLQRLAIGTGIAVALSLAMVFLNGLTFSWKPLAAVVTSIVDLLVLAGAIAFVLLIVDPDRYQVTAKRIIQQETKNHVRPGPSVADKEFFAEFVKLETAIRRLLVRKRLHARSSLSSRVPYSFRQMVDELYRSEAIQPQLYRDLQEINRYRNLVFHGHAHTAAASMVQRIKAAATELAAISPRKATAKSALSRRTTR